MFWKSKRFEIKALFPGDENAGEHAAPPVVGSFQLVRQPAPRRQHVAFIVFHGMGQQVEYETLSLLAELMVQEETKIGKYDAPPGVRVVRAKITDKESDPPLSRAEFSVRRKRTDDIEEIDVSIYEAYWAPLTEGKISFLETVQFLFGSGFNGIRSSLRRRAFKRWMFGAFQELPIKFGTVYALLSTMIGLAIALSPLALAYHYWQNAISGSFHWNIFQNHPLLSLLSLGVLGFYSWAIRYFAVEYAGDVAIYVSAHKVSRFEETRRKIQETVFDVVRQVYSAKSGGNWGSYLYDKVVFVGHSLGSVIAYDALNAAISWDLAEKGNAMCVVPRTSALITFGSPLDKTAFLFRTQVSGPRFLREALAAQRQPLILDYQTFRPNTTFRWTNIYSRADIISGRLAYYDTPDSQTPDRSRNPVRNERDWGAWIPIVAHIQYWKNQKLRTELYDAIK